MTYFRHLFCLLLFSGLLGIFGCICSPVQYTGAGMIQFLTLDSERVFSDTLGHPFHIQVLLNTEATASVDRGSPFIYSAYALQCGPLRVVDELDPKFHMLTLDQPIELEGEVILPHHNLLYYDREATVDPGESFGQALVDIQLSDAFWDRVDIPPGNYGLIYSGKTEEGMEISVEREIWIQL